MRMYLVLEHDEVQKEIPYALVCETMEGARWRSGKRRRLMKAWFSDVEISRIYELKSLAHRWYLTKGVPDEVKMTVDTYQLWQKLADFCMEL